MITKSIVCLKHTQTHISLLQMCMCIVLFFLEKKFWIVWEDQIQRSCSRYVYATSTCKYTLILALWETQNKIRLFFSPVQHRYLILGACMVLLSWKTEIIVLQGLAASSFLWSLEDVPWTIFEVSWTSTTTSCWWKKLKCHVQALKPSAQPCKNI